MGRIEQLVENYGRFAALPWEQNLAGAQRVWFAVYDKSDERRLRIRLGEFELATKSAKHGWKLVDVSGAFAEWMAAEEYHESYFQAPDDLEMAMSGFLDFVSARVKSVWAVRGLPTLPSGITDPLKELSNEGKRKRGLHPDADGRQLLRPVAAGPKYRVTSAVCQRGMRRFDAPAVAR